MENSIEELVKKLEEKYLNKAVKFGDIDVEESDYEPLAHSSQFELLSDRSIAYLINRNGTENEWINIIFELDKADEELEELDEFDLRDILVKVIEIDIVYS
ncbi:hypothetical protein [Clostridium sp. VAP23]|uniref:hypothetical protein n=1 Tax=Clostridium sp. VAP23 TaxID=2949981 RepID=UPI002079B873|nr:hypothetical protein [Clostridium sp. VAP23]